MILWNGSCMVHEIFSVGDLLRQKKRLPRGLTLAHPECPANIREHSDFVGGTEAMLKYVGGFARRTTFSWPPRPTCSGRCSASSPATAITRCRASPAPEQVSAHGATAWKSSATACARHSRDQWQPEFGCARDVVTRSLLN